MIAAAVLAAAVVLAHPNSLSSSRIQVEGAQVRVELRCQVLSLEEVLGPFDVDGDDFVSGAEVDARAAQISDYVLGHYRMSLADGDVRVALEGEVSSVRLSPPTGQVFRGLDLVDVHFAFRAAERIDALAIDVTLFEEAGPDHIDLCQIVWHDLDPVPRTFDRSQRTLLFPPGADQDSSTFTRFASLGIDHILGGWDHLAFVVALLLGTRHARSLVGVVTAFTVAHSVVYADPGSKSVRGVPVEGQLTEVEPAHLGFGGVTSQTVVFDELLHCCRSRDGGSSNGQA